MTADDPYLYAGSSVLKNKLGLKDADALDYAEREIVAQRAAQGIPGGQFDLKHLRAIHRHLFQDIYAWAGDIRTVEIAKGGSQFQFCRFIETGMGDVHRRIVEMNYLRGLDRDRFAAAAGEVIGDINYVHPFREGNGRTQMFYLRRLAAQAGHALQLARIDPVNWMAGSRAAHHADYGLLSAEIAQALKS